MKQTTYIFTVPLIIIEIKEISKYFLTTKKSLSNEIFLQIETSPGGSLKILTNDENNERQNLD